MNKNKFLAVFFASFFAFPFASVIIEKLLSMLFPYGFASQIIFAPAIEETGKIALFLFFAKKFFLDDEERRDANDAKLLLFIGFAFGLAENVLFALAAYSSYSALHFVERIIVAQIFHTLIPLTYLYARKRLGNLYAVLLPVLLHAIWNGFIYFELNSIFVYLFVSLLTVFTIYKLLRIK